MDSFISDNDLVIVFEWAAAGDLKRQLRKAQERNIGFDERVIWKYFSQICDAMKHMHEKRIMHRDLKPANIFLTLDGTIKVGDLGLSRELSEHTIQAHSKVGTPLYMSPEVLRGDGYDFKSDIWSLGCLLYELAMLKSPFKSEGLNLYSLFQKISQGSYQPLPDTYSEELRSLSHAMISIKSDERPEIGYVCEVANRMRTVTADRYMRAKKQYEDNMNRDGMVSAAGMNGVRPTDEDKEDGEDNNDGDGRRLSYNSNIDGNNNNNMNNKKKLIKEEMDHNSGRRSNNKNISHSSNRDAVGNEVGDGRVVYQGEDTVRDQRRPVSRSSRASKPTVQGYNQDADDRFNDEDVRMERKDGVEDDDDDDNTQDNRDENTRKLNGNHPRKEGSVRSSGTKGTNGQNLTHNYNNDDDDDDATLVKGGRSTNEGGTNGHSPRSSRKPLATNGHTLKNKEKDNKINISNTGKPSPPYKEDRGESVRETAVDEDMRSNYNQTNDGGKDKKREESFKDLGYAFALMELLNAKLEALGYPFYDDGIKHNNRGRKLSKYQFVCDLALVSKKLPRGMKGQNSTQDGTQFRCLVEVSKWLLSLHGSNAKAALTKHNLDVDQDSPSTIATQLLLLAEVSFPI